MTPRIFKFTSQSV